MKSIFSLALLFVATLAAATDSFPPGYWDRNYGNNIQSASYMISLKVDKISKAEKEIDRRMTRAGGALSSLNGGNGYYGNYGNQQGQKSKSMSYTLDEHKAESAAKSIFDLGDLQQFSTQKQQVSSQFDEIKKKLKQVTDEIDGNADELKKMPIASYFLFAQRDRLTQSRDAYESGLKKASINITLIERSADGK